ncbi:acyltransferase [Lichenihabitans sp. Uapishka_5]|uniref:acyltransferase family protein n=1 Tax=Lichenihabitans sp. Uapishka_5 TaxID=3037302 RepID=UPI0029E803E9|nr:acyltransferase [Lichenihabitans sp. Uapishka_5]MDX7953687.1 acyltransferase [Lichenihabitans sp. Uapishka_5]
MRSDEPVGRNRMLDAIRGIAALAVVGYHLQGAAPFVPFVHGYAAVDVFFVLSGFVLATAKGEALASGGIGTGRFMAWRLARLMPMIWIGTLLGAAIMPIGTSHPDRAMMLAMGLLMIPMLSGSPPGNNAFPLAPAAWSLFAELVVNAAWPTLARRNDKSAVLAMAIGTGAILIIGGCLRFGDVDFGATPGSIGVGMGRAVFGFAAGIALQATRHRLPRLPSWVGYGLLVFDLMVPPPAIMGPWWDGVMTLFVAPTIVAASVNAVVGRPTQIIANLGTTLSYPLYATHGPIVASLGTALGSTTGDGLARTTAILGVLACCLGIAWCASRLERLIRRMAHRLAKAPRWHRIGGTTLNRGR